MNINAGIIDQHVRGLAQRIGPQLEQAADRPLDETTARSMAFVVLCAKVMLDLTDAEAIDLLTEGGNDFGVDAIHIGDVVDGEFVVTLLQAKYHHANLDGIKGFPQSGVEKMVQAVRALFDPASPVQMNPRLHAQIEEVRSLILDGNIPRVRVLLCSNGESWKQPESQGIIDREKFGDRVSFEHVNHDVLVRVLQSTAPVKDTLQFSGKVIVEDFNYARVVVGKMPVSELARLMDAHGDRLLERNIRRYLGLSGNRVNEAIQETLSDESERANFYFYNNGVTLICDRFDYNALQAENHKVRVEGLQIINGGQTSKTVQVTLHALGEQPGAGGDWSTAYVLVRLYQVSKESTSVIQTITYATNSQNPVDLRDLRSGDEVQRRLELSVRQLGFEYRRQRVEGVPRPVDISVGTAAEAVLSVWRRKPHQAKFRSGDRFGKYYNQIFTNDLNASQLIVAVLLLRIAENKRKRLPADSPDFVSYASYFASMLMGEYLLADLGLAPHQLDQLDHRKFEQARALVDAKGDEYFRRATDALRAALAKLYGNQQISLRRLSATFRRGDLLELL